MNYLLFTLVLLSCQAVTVKSKMVDFICPKRGIRPANGKVLSSHSVKTAPDCAWLCLDDPNCTSFLVNNPRSSTMGCELRDQSGVDQPELVEDSSTDYYRKRECDSHPCANGGVCTELVYGYTCECKEGFEGRACETVPVTGADCADIKKAVPSSDSGVYTIILDDSSEVEVYCDMDTDGGGWLLFQKRVNGTLDFYKLWDEYAAGFGDLEEDFWLGNRNLHLLTSQRSYTLRVYLEDFDDESRYAEYTSFAVGPESDEFRLTVGAYSGNAGDALAGHNQKQFSTRDRDNDGSGGHCAQEFKGAWWYHGCHAANLNGLYLGGTNSLFAQGVVWEPWRGYSYSLKSTMMMIRPTDY